MFVRTQNSLHRRAGSKRAGIANHHCERRLGAFWNFRRPNELKAQRTKRDQGCNAPKRVNPHCLLPGEKPDRTGATIVPHHVPLSARWHDDGKKWGRKDGYCRPWEHLCGIKDGGRRSTAGLRSSLLMVLWRLCRSAAPWAASMELITCSKRCLSIADNRRGSGGRVCAKLLCSAVLCFARGLQIHAGDAIR